MSGIYHYRTIRKQVTSRFSDKGSKFLATTAPVTSADGVELILSNVRGEHPKARHICMAYRLLEDGQPKEYCTDAGEPRGSAGLPILNALRSCELLNVVAVVVRYFGGTKLGIPGLIHAYGHSVQAALADSEIVEVQRTFAWSLAMPMALQPHLLEAAKRIGLTITDLHYAQRLAARVEAPMPEHDHLLVRLLQIISKRDDTDLHRLAEYLNIEILDQFPSAPTSHRRSE